MFALAFIVPLQCVDVLLHKIMGPFLKAVQGKNHMNLTMAGALGSEQLHADFLSEVRQQDLYYDQL